MPGLSKEQEARYTVLFRKKSRTLSESDEYQALINIKDADKKDEAPAPEPVALKRKPAPWYINVLSIISAFIAASAVNLIMVLTWQPEPYAASGYDRLGSSFTNSALIIGSLVIGAWIPRAIWRNRQRKAAEVKK